MRINFTKMNGAGNDFVVIDGRSQLSGGGCQLSGEQIRTLSARNNPITKGCDQLIVLEKSEVADVFMRIYNADGEVDACGNATRCIASLLEKKLGRLPVTIETNAGILQGVKKINDCVLVDMGEPKFGWQDIPLAMPIEEATKRLKEFIGLKNPTFVSIGNPHVVFFVDNIPEDKDVAKIGSALENYTEIFPQRINVSFAKITAEVENSDFIIYAKTWERGAGLTKSCGTGACAMLVAANKQRTDIQSAVVKFVSYGECVTVHISKNKHILLGGAVEKDFEAIVDI